MHPNSVLLFERYLRPLFAVNHRVLEIGPDTHPSTFQRIVGKPTIRWETLDLQADPRLTYVAKNEYQFPIPDATFDVVFSSQVIEHVRRPWVWIREVARVCKPGGYVLTVNPVSWPYHEAPIDCWRIYPEGMGALYQEAGLSVLLCKFECLEVSDLNRGRIVPGTSAASGVVGSVKLAIKRAVGWPILCAFDTVTIGVKDDGPSSP
jgi:SAM-dependent methyltransferase